MSSSVMHDEQQMLDRARSGDDEAFERLVRHYERYVYNLALRVTGNPDEAEDLAQQAFIRAWRGLPGFRGQARFSTWLYRIVINLCYNRLPGLKIELAMASDDQALDLPDERQEVEAGLVSAELRAFLHQAIERLPESYRLLLTLRHLQEMSYDEIGQVTGIPLGTVKTGIFRARQMLREALERYETRYEPERFAD